MGIHKETWIRFVTLKYTCDNSIDELKGQGAINNSLDNIAFKWIIDPPSSLPPPSDESCINHIVTSWMYATASTNQTVKPAYISIDVIFLHLIDFK